jgi:hypothetical protein
MEGKAPTGLYITLAIVLAVLGLVLVVRKDILAYLTGEDTPVVSEETAEESVEDLVSDADPVGNPIDEDFASQALAIADAQYQELNQYSQDEYGMMASLMPLEGGQLVQVFEQFGARLYEPTFGDSTYLNLFQWYQMKLDNSNLWGQSIQLDWEGVPEEWIPTDIPSCGGGGFCTEKEAFRAIWWRSGLPLTF